MSERTLLNQLARLSREDLFVAMDRDTYRQFATELGEDIKSMSRGPDHERACIDALALAGEQTGLTKIEYMGNHICICDWLRGLAWAPYTGDPAKAPRCFITGRF